MPLGSGILNWRNPSAFADGETMLPKGAARAACRWRCLLLSAARHQAAGDPSATGGVAERAPSMDIAGNVAVVTGSAAGTGRVIALAWADVCDDRQVEAIVRWAADLQLPGTFREPTLASRSRCSRASARLLGPLLAPAGCRGVGRLGQVRLGARALEFFGDIPPSRCTPRPRTRPRPGSGSGPATTADAPGQPGRSARTSPPR